MKTGRPELYTKELGDTVCEAIANGQSMRGVCREKGMPSLSTVFKWIREIPEFTQQYARATEERTEAHAEDTLEISDNSVKLAQSVDPKAAGAVVQAARLQVDTRKWLMSKMKPKKYGDKLDVTSGNKPIPLLHAISNNVGDPKDSQPKEEN